MHIWTSAIAVALLLHPVHASGQMASPEAGSLGTVRIPVAVLANNAPLAAGSYEIRLTDERLTFGTDQSTDTERWIVFVRDGSEAGRDVAVVIPGADIRAIAEGTVPDAGERRVEILKGGDILRIWVNRGGTHYLVHLPLARGR